MNKKTIVITGAASGIGLETALLFAKNGWFVGLFDINQFGLDDLAARIGPESCFSRVMDVSDADSVRRGIDVFAERTGGKIHVLLNNAGILNSACLKRSALLIITGSSKSISKGASIACFIALTI